MDKRRPLLIKSTTTHRDEKGTTSQGFDAWDIKGLQEA